MYGHCMADEQQDPASTARLLRRRLEAGPIELPVNGSSMRGVIESGSTVVVEAAPAPRRGEIWVFMNDDAVIVVHRVREVDGMSVTGRGSGNPLDDVPVPLDHAVGRVLALTTPSGTTKRFGIVDRRFAQLMFRIRRVAIRMPLIRRLRSGR